MAAEGIVNGDPAVWGGVTGGVVLVTIRGNSTQPAATASAYTQVITCPWE